MSAPVHVHASYPGDQGLRLWGPRDGKTPSGLVHLHGPRVGLCPAEGLSKLAGCVRLLPPPLSLSQPQRGHSRECWHGHVKGVLASLPVCRGQRKGLSQWNSRADGLCVMSRWNPLPSAAQTPSRSPLCLWQGGEVPARPGRRGKEPQFAPAHVTFVLCWSLLSLCWRWPRADWG